MYIVYSLSDILYHVHRYIPIHNIKTWQKRKKMVLRNYVLPVTWGLVRDGPGISGTPLLY